MKPRRMDTDTNTMKDLLGQIRDDLRAHEFNEEHKFDKLNSSVETMHTELKEHVVVDETFMKSMMSWTEKIDARFIGREGDAANGIIVRLDRLEQAQQRQSAFSRWALGILGTLIAAIILAILEMLRSHQ